MTPFTSNLESSNAWGLSMKLLTMNWTPRDGPIGICRGIDATFDRPRYSLANIARRLASSAPVLDGKGVQHHEFHIVRDVSRGLCHNGKFLDRITLVSHAPHALAAVLAVHAFLSPFGLWAYCGLS